MKKIPFILLFFFTSIFVFSQQNEKEGFISIPKINDIKDLVKNIKPNTEYKIGALVHYDFKTNNILYQKGNRKINPERTESDSYGFFPCLPGGCYSYFYAINKNNKPEYITHEKELYHFLGEINNIEEAMFIAMLYGYVMDEDYKNGNIYKESKDEFVLYLAKISTSPSLKKEGFMITIKKNGELTAKSDGIYHYNPNVRIDI
ncbi:hypothetical protein [Chryseobacterium arthrosphaerae]|uniref:hypothetical protein n=1 Tax=Chryseobacterium arthrosphaerae TaxID=651561 RepID=UPI001F4B25C4|nr:hypothetical protein [Chryseobacterium arthrosphaerae]